MCWIVKSLEINISTYSALYNLFYRMYFLIESDVPCLYQYSKAQPFLVIEPIDWN